MLVMFGAGAGSVPLMLGLGTVTALEKNAPWGRRISTPLGIEFLCGAGRDDRARRT